jgi:hypothetical protein
VTRAKAVITDYVGTLVNARYYNIDASRKKLHKALMEAGLETKLPEFLKAYTQAHNKYRAIRYEHRLPRGPSNKSRVKRFLPRICGVS